jgi:hydrogenase maturation factor
MIGKVIDKHDDNVIVEYGEKSCSAKCVDVEVEVGDWVTVDAGYIVNVMTESEALEQLKHVEASGEEEDEDFI